LETSVCARCNACVDACPLGAFSKDKTITRTICGKTFEMAEINFELCKNAPTAGWPTAAPDRQTGPAMRHLQPHLPGGTGKARHRRDEAGLPHQEP
jgi:ferredoxin